MIMKKYITPRTEVEEVLVRYEILAESQIDDYVENPLF